MNDISPTIVKFNHQTWQLTTTIQLVQSDQQQGHYIVTAETPFHPVSHIWPDHPADRGMLVVNEKREAVVDCLTGAVELATGELFVAEAIPVKRDTSGWAFVVVHRVNSDLLLNVGDSVLLEVNQAYQQRLSRGHSAGHLAYLALNKILNGHYWRKDADRKDELGHYDFNSYALETSFVTEDCCTDTYRLGKTLRKRGLNSAEMVENLPAIESAINAQLAAWLALNSDIEVVCDGERLTDSRYWHCHLGESGKAVIPCGGTHVNSLAEYRSITVVLTLVDAQQLQMVTTSCMTR
ncbi:alanyl-tRNA editing protein [Aliivibrio kagoshimensis]|uniref:alanyl-tRNA editing protein n=1 Tax=Aliivibrio kagoshimensis TaxID=2910230 RepID=UPI003D0FF130